MDSKNKSLNLGKSVSRFRVTGLDCDDEVKAVQSALLSIKGIINVESNRMTSEVLVEHDPSVSATTIKEGIRSAGLGISKDEAPNESNVDLKRRTILVSVSGILFSLAFILDRIASLPNGFITSIYIASILVGGSLIAPKALRSFKTFTLDMNVLMLVATLGAVAIREYAEAAAVVFLFAVAEWLEAFSAERARKSVHALLKIVPETALLRDESGSFSETPITAVAVGSTIRIRSGARVPLDGIVIEGVSSVNQAPITGESMPVERKKDDRVLAGTINGEGSLDVRVTQSHNDTKIAQIVRLIEDAEKRKAPTQNFVDAFARYYTPIVFAVAILTLLVPTLFFGGDWSAWIYRSLVILVIACPCALVVATPVSIVSGLTAMAKKGILIKGGSGLEQIGKLKALAVDKTGTITEGQPRVQECHSINGASDQETLSLAASIDSHSTHPLAKAVVDEAKKKNVLFPESTSYKAITGRGAEAFVHERKVFVGNHRLAHELGLCNESLEAKLKEIENRALSVVVVGYAAVGTTKGEVIGVLGLGDSIRKDAGDAVQALHKAGIEKVIMLSGDNQLTVNAVSKQVGIDEAYGELLPEDKVQKIEELKTRFHSVAMIGDGVNDAPAMATATLGIAMGASGTDVAIETSDLTLMRDSLVGVADAIIMGKRTIRMIWFNTGFALMTKFTFLVLSMTGHSSLWLAIAADTGATLIVIGNALRLLK
jgi:Zn2+/Cd2+-exporting ATPase